MGKIGLLGLVFAVFIFAAGCGQDIKKENEQLKAQVATLTEEATAVKNRAANLQKEIDDLKAQNATLTEEKASCAKEIEGLKAKSGAKKKKK